MSDHAILIWGSCVCWGAFVGSVAHAVKSLADQKGASFVLGLMGCGIDAYIAASLWEMAK